MRTWQTISAVILGQCVTVAAMSAETGTGAKMINDVQPEMVLDRLLTAIARRDLSATLACFSSGQAVAIVRNGSILLKNSVSATRRFSSDIAIQPETR